MKKDALGARIKRYEQAHKYYLTPRTPVIVRVDGKAFHSYTKGMERPYDPDLIKAMVYAAAQTAQFQMQGCIAAYVQSDECTFLLADYQSLESQGWFNYELNKIVSISASAYTYYFNEMMNQLGKKGVGPALFDSRAFNVPAEDMPNAFIWRQKDWVRNSVQMLARAHFSHKELNGKKVPDLHEMLHSKGVNWAKLPEQLKNGTFLFKWDNWTPDYRTHDYDGLRQRLLAGIDAQE